MQENSYAKVNIYLKITGTKEFNGSLYHTIKSRFVLVKNLYDTISFVPCKCKTFTIEGIDIPKEQNLIYKAYKAFNLHTGDLEIIDFFRFHKVVVKKNIPFGAGLGGGSSNAATFMRMVHKYCNLLISIDELAKIGATIGADVPFFIYNYESANVSGFGEIIQPFKEESLNIEVFTPPIACNTKKVYEAFDNYCQIDKEYQNWQKIPSKELLEKINDPFKLNDLFAPALKVYPTLKQYYKNGYFFSGSGSSFFKVK